MWETKLFTGERECYMESRSRIFQVGLQGLIITGKLTIYKPKKKIPGFLS